MIPEHKAGQLREIEGAAGMFPVSYYLGEIEIAEDTLKWKKYFPEIAGEGSFRQDGRLIEKFDGVCARTDSGYRIKSNIYGYEDQILMGLDVLS